jgi:hypothetical protein
LTDHTACHRPRPAPSPVVIGNQAASPPLLAAVIAVFYNKLYLDKIYRIFPNERTPIKPYKAKKMKNES